MDERFFLPSLSLELPALVAEAEAFSRLFFFFSLIRSDFSEDDFLLLFFSESLFFEASSTPDSGEVVEFSGSSFLCFLALAVSFSNDETLFNEDLESFREVFDALRRLVLDDDLIASLRRVGDSNSCDRSNFLLMLDSVPGEPTR